MREPVARPVIVDGRRWRIVCARFETVNLARVAFDVLARKLGRVSADENGVGYYRHGTTDPDSGRWITVVGLGDENARLERARRVLTDSGGADERLHSTLAESIVRRRIAMVREHGGETGRMRISSPENAGRVLLPDGRMVPLRRGQG